MITALVPLPLHRTVAAHQELQSELMIVGPDRLAVREEEIIPMSGIHLLQPVLRPSLQLLRQRHGQVL